MNDKIEYRIKEILFTKEEIEKRVKELAGEINSYYNKEQLLLIGILKGAFVFLADLMRNLELSVEIDFIEVSSYGVNTESSGNINIGKDIKMGIKGKNILLVEDIIDSGYTIAYLREELYKREPKSIKICSLLDKPARRKVPINIDFCGFSVPDAFVVGCGMDVNEKFRNLPFIAVVEKLIKKEKIKS
jgi:hypoxanthine phosphoribosyltransferase